MNVVGWEIPRWRVIERENQQAAWYESWISDVWFDLVDHPFAFYVFNGLITLGGANCVATDSVASYGVAGYHLLSLWLFIFTNV